jgi:hypothetical protein
VIGQEAPWLLVQHKGRARRHPIPQAALIPNNILPYVVLNLRCCEGLEMGPHLWSKMALALNFRFPACFIQAYIQQHRILVQGSCNHLK